MIDREITIFDLIGAALACVVLWILIILFIDLYIDFWIWLANKAVDYAG